MTHNPYAPLVAQFRSETDSASDLPQACFKVVRRRATASGQCLQPPRAVAYGASPMGLAMLEREVDRIRLQSRHWLM